MRTSRSLIDRIAPRFFGAKTRDRRAPHPLFSELYARVRTALEDAELCLHLDLTSRPNSVDIFFNFDTWGQFVASRRAQVEQALETEIEAYRRDAGYRDDERIALRLFVADPAQLDVSPNSPEVFARRVPDPLALDERWASSLKHTTVVGGQRREGQVRFPATRAERPADTARDASSLALVSAPTAPVTRLTPLAILGFRERGRERIAALEGPGLFGRGAGCAVQVELEPGDGERAIDVVSRRALSFSTNASTGVLEVENLGRWPLDCSSRPAAAGGAEETARTFKPGTRIAVERQAELIWPGDGGDRFRLTIQAPRRGTLTLRGEGGEQRVVLRSPRTPAQADSSIFGEVDVRFNVDFVDGTRFLILNNEGAVPLRLGALEGKQLQWPIDAPRELEAGAIVIAIELEEGT